jgi:hypothetical protein
MPPRNQGGQAPVTVPEPLNLEPSESQDLAIGWVHPGEVHTAFFDSFMRSVIYDARVGGNRIAGWNGVQCSANVSSGRNALVEWFLTTDAQWLMQIDTDMVWEPDAVHRLLAVADPVHAPIVGGLCFGLEADTGTIFPTLYHVGGTEEQIEFLRLRTFPAADLFKVAGTGAAFLLAHRSVFERMRDREPMFSTAYPYFQERELGGLRCGEDVTFCMRAAALDIPVHVNTNVHIGHIKPMTVTVQAYAMQLAHQDAQRQSGEQQ